MINESIYNMTLFLLYIFKVYKYFTVIYKNQPAYRSHVWKASSWSNISNNNKMKLLSVFSFLLFWQTFGLDVGWDLNVSIGNWLDCETQAFHSSKEPVLIKSTKLFKGIVRNPKMLWFTHPHFAIFFMFSIYFYKLKDTFK